MNLPDKVYKILLELQENLLNDKKAILNFKYSKWKQ